MLGNAVLPILVNIIFATIIRTEDLVNETIRGEEVVRHQQFVGIITHHLSD